MTLSAGQKIFFEMAEQISNWNRWGSEDEIGTLNLIDSAAIRRGAGAVRQGKAFPLGIEFGASGPQTGSIEGRFNPHHYMVAIGAPFEASGDGGLFRSSDDVIVMPLQCATQWDSLAHVHYHDKLFNGACAHKSLGVNGTQRNGIEKQAQHGYVSRGLLLDIPRAMKQDGLDDNFPITLDVVQRTLEFQKLSVEPGDILLLRTGHMRVLQEERELERYTWNAPGLRMDVVPWLHEMGVAAIGADNAAVEVLHSGYDDLFCPVHLLTIRDMGMPLGEMFNLEALAADCASDGVYEFQICAQPLGVTGGIGSPVNPVAIK